MGFSGVKEYCQSLGLMRGSITATVKWSSRTRAKKFYLGAIYLDNGDYCECAMLTKVTATTGGLTT